MSQIFSIRVPDDLFTLIENHDETKTEIGVKSLRNYLEKPKEQSQEQSEIISASEIKELIKFIRILYKNQMALESKIEALDKKLFSLEQRLFDDTMAIRDDISKLSNHMYLMLAQQNKTEIPKHFG